MTTEPDLILGALQRFVPDANAIHSIDATAHLAGIPRHWILVYCRHGLVTPIIDPQYGGFYFDATGIRTLQQIHYLRADCDINVAGIRIILGLMEEVERLRQRVEV
jgi:DNA-binding transcriptional MerR regulator